MVVTEISLFLLLMDLLIAGVCSTSVPYECLKCNAKAESAVADNFTLCANITAPNCSSVPPAILSNCTTDFQVSVNSTGSTDAGENFTLSCVHDLPVKNLTFWWEKDGEEFQGDQPHGSQLFFESASVSDAGLYTCHVNSSCGGFDSLSHKVTVQDNSEVLLIICGVAALVLVVVMGLAMKFKLQRDNKKHKERREQRTQAGQSGGPAPFTPRSS